MNTDIKFDPRLPIMLDKERYLYCSLYVIDEIQGKFGSWDNLPEVMAGADGLKNIIWLLTMLLNEGAVYTKYIETGEIAVNEEVNERLVSLLLNAANLQEIRAAIYKSFAVSTSGKTADEIDDEDEDDEDDDENNDDENDEDKEEKNVEPGD